MGFGAQENRIGYHAYAFRRSLGELPHVGTQLLTAIQRRFVYHKYRSLPGISLEESDKIGRQAEELLLSIPEIKTVARKTGRAELDEHALGVNVSEIEAPFELEDRSHTEVLEDVRRKLSVISGANIEIGQPISHRIDAMLSGTQAGIAIKLFGDDLNKMYQIGNQIKSAVSDVKGIADLNVEQQIERPELKIEPKREMLARYGISLPQFNEFVTVNMGGEVVSQVYEKGRSFNLIVRSAEDNRSTMERIRNLMIDDAQGNKVPFSYGGRHPVVHGAEHHQPRKRETQNRHLGQCQRARHARVVNDIRSRIDEKVKLPEGYHIEYGARFESEESASRVLLLTSFISIRSHLPVALLPIP